uniref:Uncharacterized protein n=1 Tax=Timema tahoe TaxID=61484 RepID=A0A7R9IPW4_9NEOP|nr:unnamed protein product [Timema tahoe]
MPVSHHRCTIGFFRNQETAATVIMLVLIFGANELPSSFPYQVLAGIIVTVMALVLFAAVSYQCAATWKWLKELALGEGESGGEDALSKQAAIRISHSLPDLNSEPTRQEYVQENKESKKQQVLRQTTLPSVPTRHQTFQRQLSHRLDLNNIQFSICSLEHRNDFSIGLIKIAYSVLSRARCWKMTSLLASLLDSLLVSLDRSRDISRAWFPAGSGGEPTREKPSVT